ncbi:DUF3015 family protein [Pseudomonadales bacterium]|nr:DUF3015 family protein [Pseudomonadales bacterium]MDB2509689.1 DUF3015 family protein [Pseudomonadales bacterium]MDC1367658.1 DUF3015 family protein [Pseudomonadales bacterium]
MKKQLFLITTLTVLSASAMAYNPWSQCGIGAALFPNTHWGAVTSNVIWDMGTTANISATLSRDTCNGAETRMAMLIHDKLESLELEIMTDQGEVLTAIFEVMSCDTSSQIIPSLRKETVKLLSTDQYPSQTRVGKAENLYFLINENQEFKQSCSKIS